MFLIESAVHRGGLTSKADMKSKIVRLVTLGILLPSVCHAEQSPPSPKSDGNDRPPFKEVWKHADKDGNGLISTAEFDSLPRLQKLPDVKRKALFKRLDKDSNGKLSRQEIGKMGKPSDGERMPFKRLWELDADKSGGIGLEEFKLGQFAQKLPAERQIKVFNRLDSDGDGTITPKDRPKQSQPFPDGNHRPMDEGIDFKLDTDGDGTISFAEFRVGPAMKDKTEDQQENRFELLDRNKDRKLSAEDFPEPSKQ